MANQLPKLSSSTTQAENGAQDFKLPPEVLSIIAQYLAIEPGVTTEDQTVQRRRNMLAFCLASEKLLPTAVDTLYEVIAISNRTTLSLFRRTVKSRSGLGLLVRKLSVTIKLCSCLSTEKGTQELCNCLFEVLESTAGLRYLSLDLQECTNCFRNFGLQDFAPNGNGASSGYDTFYERVARCIRKESKVEPNHRRFLPKVEEFHFSSTDVPYDHGAFFALPSLKRIVSIRDTGEWFMILYSAPENRTRKTHIRELTLKNSAILPFDLRAIRQHFPNLETFRVRNDPSETLRRYYSPRDLADANFWNPNFSGVLANMPNLRLLELDLHYPICVTPPVDFPRHLGPAGGITGLHQLPFLTNLRIGMNQLMRFRVIDGQPRACPLLPDVLPQTLVRLQLYTCLSCWDNRLIRFSLGTAWHQTLPSYAGGSTFSFVKSLVDHVSIWNRFPSLRDVRLYSRVPWWLAYGLAYRTVWHCPEEKGQVWNAGGLEEACWISRFDYRTPGIHFRAYQSDEHDCVLLPASPSS